MPQMNRGGKYAFGESVIGRGGPVPLPATHEKPPESKNEHETIKCHLTFIYLAL